MTDEENQNWYDEATTITLIDKKFTILDRVVGSDEGYCRFVCIEGITYVIHRDSYLAFPIKIYEASNDD